MTDKLDNEIEKIAGLEWEPVPETALNWKDHTASWVYSQKLVLSVVTKTKAQLVEHVAEMGDDLFDDVLEQFENAALKGKADMDMANAAKARIMAASAVLAMEETAGTRKKKP